MKIYTFLLLISVIIGSCIRDTKSILKVDLKDFSGDYVLHLDDLMTDIRVVKLPTTDEILVPQGYESFVGEKFILILSYGSILQFDDKGDFIRKLAREGNGPGEITYISSFDVDDEEEKLYIHSANDRGSLFVFNLITGEVLPKIELPDNMLERFIIDGDHILWIDGPYPEEPPKIYRQFYTMSFSGDSISTRINTDMHDNYIIQGRMKFIKRVKNKVYFLDQINDTLFTIDGTEQIPFCVLNVDDRYNFNSNLEGNIPLIDILSENKIKLMNQKLDVKKGPGKMWMMGDRDKKDYLWNPKANTLNYISAYYNDFFMTEVDDLKFASRGDFGYLEYSAMDFKALLSQTLGNAGLNSEKRKQLMELDLTITEQDNPIFLIGHVINN